MSAEFRDPKVLGEDVPDGTFGGSRPAGGTWRLWTREEQVAHLESLGSELSSRQAARQTALLGEGAL